MHATYAVKIESPARDLSHPAADSLARAVLAEHRGRRVLLDLAGVERTTMAALASLVLLRRRLRKSGGDLAVIPPTGSALTLYSLCRLEASLPAPEAGAAVARKPARAALESTREGHGFLGGLVRAMGQRVWAWAGGSR